MCISHDQVYHHSLYTKILVIRISIIYARTKMLSLLDHLKWHIMVIPELLRHKSMDGTTVCIKLPLDILVLPFVSLCLCCLAQSCNRAHSWRRLNSPKNLNKSDQKFEKRYECEPNCFTKYNLHSVPHLCFYTIFFTSVMMYFGDFFIFKWDWPYPF